MPERRYGQTTLALSRGRAAKPSGRVAGRGSAADGQMPRWTTATGHPRSASIRKIVVLPLVSYVTTSSGRQIGLR
jgi:hypothetical protein